MPTDDRDRARSAVSDRIAELGLTRAEVARRAGVALNTLRDFLDGRKWPMERTAEAIERVLDWPVSGIAGIANGGSVPEVSQRDGSGHGTLDRGDVAATFSQAHESDMITVSLAPGALDGLDPLSIAQVEAEARVAALRFLRELQSSRRRREEEPTP